MPQTEPDVSIIVRAHNDQKKLLRTLRSLLAQTLPGLEIVVVDQGSRDRSYELALELQAQAPGRLRLHRLQCVGAAWNTGLALARGKYVGFADAGGWAEPEMLAALRKACEGRAADIASAPYFSGPRRIARDFASRRGVWDRQACREELLPGALADYTGLALWSKLFRRNFLLQNSLRISEEYGQGEEALFLARCLARCQCLVTLARPYYHYKEARRPRPPARARRLAQYTHLAALLREADMDTDEARQLLCTRWMGRLLEICGEEYRLSRSEAAFYRRMIALAGEPAVEEALACAQRAALPRRQMQCYDAFLARDWARLRRLARRQIFRKS